MSNAPWTLILGVSGGFGSAIAEALAEAGFNILGIYLDTADKLPEVEALIGTIRGHGREARFFNLNAANENAMLEVMAEIPGITGGAPIQLLIHALAFGSLLPFIADETAELPAINRRQMDMTLSVMANSLVYWTQALVKDGWLASGGKIFALTSIGSTNVLANYGAVSAAKAALESHVRQLAMELAPRNIAVNAIRAGVTPTPALMKIPNAPELLERAIRQNPFHRVTTPEDIAEVITALAGLKTAWLTGNVIGVDGGEKLTV